ncbi:Tripeptidyl-peptidase 1-like [Oopsacas minuta]|uniref:Tripeptidyl-peptidase 1-like n=1 Tax=Oopsacas minuta TaxID=111878 RepID=A0AAV7K9X8_9METZ|nr:Tripeptidyl-peptidase 1-like [Oopsacas minuta]
MVSLLTLLILLLCNTSLSLPVVSNRREQLESNPLIAHLTASTLTRWFEIRKAERIELTQIVIAIKHRSPRELEQLFWSVSDPSSSIYGQFLRQDELVELVSPTHASIYMVTSWLQRYGVNVNNSCSFTPLREFLLCELTVELVERLFQVELHVYRNEDKKLGEIMRSTTPCTVESDVKQHIDFIGGINHFHNSRYVYSKIPSLFNTEEFGTSSFNATPKFIRELYNVTGRGEAFLNKQAIVEFLGESISPGDLIAFMDSYGKGFTHYNGVDGVMGQNIPDNPGLTANLDAQYIMSLGKVSIYL